MEKLLVHKYIRFSLLRIHESTVFIGFTLLSHAANTLSTNIQKYHYIIFSIIT